MYKNKSRWENHEGQLIDSIDDIDVIQCENCGFKHIVPIPTSNELALFYREKFYEQDRKIDYFKMQSSQKEWWERVFTERCMQFEQLLGRKGRILDIGSGPGFFLKKAEELGWDCVGIEPSEKAYDYSKNILKLNVHNIDVEMLDKFNFIDKGSFDVVYSHGVLEHMRSPHEFFLKALGLLADDGLVFYSVANDYNQLQEIARQKYQIKPWWLVPPEHINYFDVKSAKEIAIAHGFHIENFTSTFPIEIFMLMGDNYVGDIELGKQCHQKRVNFEDSILSSGKQDLLTKIYNQFAELEIGRQIEIIARRGS